MWQVPQTCVFVTLWCLLFIINAPNTKALTPSSPGLCSGYNLSSLANKTVASHEVPPPGGRRPLTISTILDAALNSSSKTETASGLSIPTECLDYLEFSLPEVALLLLNTSEFEQITFDAVLRGVFVPEVQSVLSSMVVFKAFIQRFDLLGNETLQELASSKNLSVEAEPVLEILLNDSDIRTLSLFYELSLPSYDLLNRTTSELAAILAVEDPGELKNYTLLHLVKISFVGKDFFDSLQITVGNIRASLHVSLIEINDEFENVTSVLELVLTKIPKSKRYLSSYILGVVGHDVQLLNVTLQEIADLTNKTVDKLQGYKIYPQLVLFIVNARAKIVEINGETRKEIEGAIREILEAYNVTVEQLSDAFNLTVVQVRKLNPLRIELLCARITLIRYATNLHLTLAEVAVKVNKTEGELSYNLTVKDFHVVIRRLLIVRTFEVMSQMLGVNSRFLVNSLNVNVPLHTLSMCQLDGFLSITTHTVLDLRGVITRKSLAFVIQINGFSITSVYKLTIEQFIIRVMRLSVHDFFALNGLNFPYSQGRLEILRRYRFAFLDRLFQIHEDIPKYTFSIFRRSVVWIINRIIFLHETDRDECWLRIDRCHRLSQCINLPGTYECRCPPKGYAGRYCEDINECRDGTAVCPVNAHCVNTPGSYRCDCSTGFRHNPINNTCDDINECDSNNNNCFWGRLQCINTVGSYECRCPAGYRFSLLWLRCLDINECSEDPGICSDIDANAFCRDTAGSYECLCRKGFDAYYNNSVSPRVFINCTDIDECARGLKVCPPNSECVNTIGGDYCRCLPSYIMRNGKCRAKRFVPVILGLIRYIRRRTCEKVSVPSGFPYFGEIYKKLYICHNGLISFGRRYYSANPRRLTSLRQNVIAVFWANTDVTFQSNIIYQVVDRSTPEFREQLDNVSDVIRNCSGDNNFNATWMMIVTWERVSPYARFFFFGNPYTNEQSTYQIAIVTNGTSSHAIYIYEDGGMEWTRRLGRRCAVGYATKNREFSYEEADSFSENIFSIDSKQFLVNGVMRRGFFCKSLDAQNKPIELTDEQRCMNWYNEEPDPDTWSDGLSDCPATRRLAARDNRYRNTRTQRRDINCYELRWPTRGFRASQQCCYFRRGRRRNAFVSDPPLAGRTYRYHYTDDRLRKISDIEPFQYCCSDAESELCSLFYEKRPLTNAASVRVFPLPCTCRFFFFCTCNRRPRRRRPFRRTFRAWFFGDPHISTLDALQYTFNGLGDYVLIRAMDNSLQLHGRTKRPLTSEGALSNATVFSGFVLKTNTSDTAQILFDDTLPGNLRITVIRQDSSCTNHTIEYFGDGRDFTEMSIERSSVNNKTVIVSFPSGFSIEVTPGIGLLQITVNANEDMMNNTQGLLGEFNGDKTDDLQYPNGTIISADSTEEEIFQLGQKWKVPDGERLFVSSNCTLQNVFFDDAFVPYFLNLSAVNESILALCGDNKECIYDVLATGNRDLGLESAGFEEENQNLVNEFANTPPEISGPAEVNVTLNQTTEFYITSRDPDNDTVTLDIDELPPDANFNSTSGHFEWTPINATNITLEFIATDSKNVSTVFTVIINLCKCENSGECDFTEFVGDSTGPFRVVGCNCSEQYEGTFCETEVLDACADEPCYENVTCATQTNPYGFQCGPCPAGLTGDGQNCFENDECANASVSRCNQTCVNTFGSFRCDCRHGFITREEGRICEDINECQEAGNMRHNCTENASCMNLPGSFNCSCNPGFEGDPYMNCTDKDECTNGEALCSQECENSPGSFRCTCRSGFQLSANQATCEDINECSTGHDCERICENVLGSYRCSCQAGLELNADNTTCRVAAGSACDSTNGGCSQLCVNRTGLVTCYCNHGYNLTNDGKTCEDINECMMGSHGCSQTCSNNIGSFMCGCHPGYQLARDNKSCEDVDECNSTGLNDCSQNCENSVGSYQCSCADGFSLQSDKTSCADIDECSTNTSDCSDGSCVNIPGSFQCKCPLPLIYSRPRCRGARVFGASLTLMALNGRPVVWKEEFNNEQSPEFGFLARSVEGQVCGFFERGKFKGVFLECRVKKFRRSSVIADIDLNFAENATDVTAEALDNELPQSGQMGNLTYNAQTATISDVDECADPATHNCHNNANCENKEGSFVCKCKDGYQGDGKTACDAAPGPVDSGSSKNQKVAIIVCSILFGFLILAFIAVAFYKSRNKRYKGDLEPDTKERSVRMMSRSVSSDVHFETDDKEKTGSYDLTSAKEPNSGDGERSRQSSAGDYDFPDPYPTGKRTTYYDNPGLTQDSAL